ncbi:hypothetical protein D3C86_1506730 [compost metagenome]
MCVCDEEIYVSSKISFCIGVSGSDQPVIGQSCKTLPVFSPFYVIFVIDQLILSSHTQSVTSVVWLSDHQTTHCAIIQEMFEDITFDHFISVLCQRLQEKCNINPKCQRQRQRFVRRRRQKSKTFFHLHASTTKFFRNSNRQWLQIENFFPNIRR